MVELPSGSCPASVAAYIEGRHSISIDEETTVIDAARIYLSGIKTSDKKKKAGGGKQSTGPAKKKAGSRAPNTESELKRMQELSARNA